MAEVTIDFVAPWTKYVAERSAPRYDAGCAQIYYAKRVLGANTIFILKAVASKYDIFTDDEDLIPTAVETRGDPAFDTSKAKDHDDDTAATYTLAPISSISLVRWDLMDARERLLYVYGGGDANMRTYVNISSDCASFTRLFDYYRTQALCAYATFRCVEIVAINYGNYYNTYYLYTVEAHNPTMKRRLTIPATTAKTVRAFIQAGYSQLLEVGEIWVD
jgi:hypothetical protein